MQNQNPNVIHRQQADLKLAAKIEAEARALLRAELIDAINALPPSTELIEALNQRKGQEPPIILQDKRVGNVRKILQINIEQHMGFVISEWVKLRRNLHRLAHLAALPPDMWGDYIDASAGSLQEWERFCGRLPAPLWRDWTEEDGWEQPSLLNYLEIGDDGRVCEEISIIRPILIGIEAKRLRECRVCRRLFWASRIEKSGGPYGCPPRCNNTWRQREHKERVRLDAKDGTRRKKP